jgi:hypothetical protein
MFEKRLQKALKQNLKTNKEIVDYCKKEMEKNYSERKLSDMQCICEYLQYKLTNDVSFNEYQEIQFKEIWR